MTLEEMRGSSYTKRVGEPKDADVIFVFVPFFAMLSAEMELAKGKGSFRRKEGNDDYKRQKEVVDFVTKTDAWKRSGGRNHVFVLTGALMFHWNLIVVMGSDELSSLMVLIHVFCSEE